MSDQPQVPLQIQALLNRLQARLGSGVADAAASLLTAAEQAPSQFSREWQLFWQEVELETQRLAQQDQDQAEPAASAVETASPFPGSAGGDTSSTDPQELIDRLRARVAALSHSLDAD